MTKKGPTKNKKNASDRLDFTLSLFIFSGWLLSIYHKSRSNTCLLYFLCPGKAGDIFWASDCEAGVVSDAIETLGPLSDDEVTVLDTKPAPPTVKDQKIFFKIFPKQEYPFF